MSNNVIEERIAKIKKGYDSIDKLIDNFSAVGVPQAQKDAIKNLVLGNDELNQLLDGVGKSRPPRILLIGRTGAGKSSLVNALCGSYLAPVSDVRSCTKSTTPYPITENGRVLMEIMDSRGISESDQLNDKITAEKQLIKESLKFSPDVVLFALPATIRDNIDSDVDFIKRVKHYYYEKNGVPLPVIVALTRVDGVYPENLTLPSTYNQQKFDKIKDIVKERSVYFKKKDLNYTNIIAVSSLINWQDTSGNGISVDDIAALSKADAEKLEIGVDYRYNIDVLRDAIETSIVDSEATAGFKMAFKLNEVLRKIANQLTNTFAGISGTVALTPIPTSDVWILLTIQSLLISFIAMLSGKEIGNQSALDTIKDFTVSIGGVAGAGIFFRNVAQQAAKFIPIPGAASGISAAIAISGTKAIGAAAITYYIDGKDIKEAKKVFKNANK